MLAQDPSVSWSREVPWVGSAMPACLTSVWGQEILFSLSRGTKAKS